MLLIQRLLGEAVKSHARFFPGFSDSTNAQALRKTSLGETRGTESRDMVLSDLASVFGGSTAISRPSVTNCAGRIVLALTVSPLPVR